jgi:hypothetical protein
LLSLEHARWEAFIFDTGLPAFDELQSVVEAFGEARFHYVQRPWKLAVPYDAKSSAYPLTDHMLETHCLSGRFEWFLVTNGDNFYAPDALNILPISKDTVLMNFHGRYPLVNSLLDTAAGAAHCCSRLQSYSCTPSSLEIGKIDLGAMLIRVSKWRSASFRFSQFTGVCGTSCHDGALAERMHAAGWTAEHHPVDKCALYHNPNPASCTMVGGIYYDLPDIKLAGCYDAAHLFHQLFWAPSIDEDWMPYLTHVDWAKYMAHACVCPRAGE